jgi:hypothetical protein
LIIMLEARRCYNCYVVLDCSAYAKRYETRKARVALEATDAIVCSRQI